MVDNNELKTAYVPTYQIIKLIHLMWWLFVSVANGLVRFENNSIRVSTGSQYR